jgi:hypothetical protein
MGILAGVVGVSAAALVQWDRSQGAVIRQAEAVQRWLDVALEKGLLQQRLFILKLPASPSEKIVLVWQGQAFTQSEVYDSRGECDFAVAGGKAVTAIYNPSYHSVSPGFTLRVLPPGERTPVRSVIVSPYARVRISLP